MASTQLSCPHCGSTLSFGVEIAEGAPVECLICMRSFAATNRILLPSPAPSKPQELLPRMEMADTLAIPATSGCAKRWPSDEVLIAKPYIEATSSVCVEEKPSASTLPSDDSEESAAQGNGLKIAVTIALLLIITGGIAFAAWKITSLGRTGPNDPDAGKLVAESTAGGAKDEKKKKEIIGTLDDEEDLRSKIQDEVKQSLKRTNAAKAGSDESDRQSFTINFTKQKMVGVDQQKIDAAIERGIAYLKSSQRADGTWHQGHAVGYASIGGLTLLECDTPAQDSTVQKAAAYVRSHTSKLTATYELSLAVLFLDRLGESRDRTLIQGMALRLLAGQTDDGGWGYQCPALNPKEMLQLHNFLRSHKQPNLHNPVGGTAKTQAGITMIPSREAGKMNNPFEGLNGLVLSQGIESNIPGPRQPGVIVPARGDSNPPSVIPLVGVDPLPLPGVKPSPNKPAQKPIHPEDLVPSLRNLPIVKNQGTKKGQTKLRRGGGDNSNTQFAMLALWAARRHDVATDQALLASYQRFLNPQNADGGWGYHPGTGSTNTMTNVGLLGLAMGHGAAPDIVRFNPKDPRDAIVKPALEDPSIQKGLQALSSYLGQPSRDPSQTSFPMKNLYFLWSVERVAMLYDLKTIGGKDWYGWGAQILVHNQRAGGEWPSEFYHGSSPPLNTCFALLFLRRSNLVQDLTDNLRLYTGIRDPEK